MLFFLPSAPVTTTVYHISVDPCVARPNLFVNSDQLCKEMTGRRFHTQPMDQCAQMGVCMHGGHLGFSVAILKKKHFFLFCKKNDIRKLILVQILSPPPHL